MKKFLLCVLLAGCIKHATTNDCDCKAKPGKIFARNVAHGKAGYIKVSETKMLTIKP